MLPTASRSRDGENGARSRPGSSPSASCATRRPASGPPVKPRNGNMATKAPGATSPITGRWSGRPGQMPCPGAQQRRARDLRHDLDRLSEVVARASRGRRQACRGGRRRAGQPPPISSEPTLACLSVSRSWAKYTRCDDERLHGLGDGDLERPALDLNGGAGEPRDAPTSAPGNR